MDNFDNVLVIDADGHVSEGDIDFAKRLPDKWRSQAPIKVRKTTSATRAISSKGGSGRPLKDRRRESPGHSPRKPASRAPA